MSKTYAVPPAAPQNHGQTVAAWVMLVGVVAGAILAALGLVLSQQLLIIVGPVVIVATIILSVVLRAAGMGQKPRGRDAESAAR